MGSCWGRTERKYALQRRTKASTTFLMTPANSVTCRDTRAGVGAGAGLAPGARDPHGGAGCATAVTEGQVPRCLDTEETQGVTEETQGVTRTRTRTDTRCLKSRQDTEMSGTRCLKTHSSPSHHYLAEHRRAGTEMPRSRTYTRCHRRDTRCHRTDTR